MISYEDFKKLDIRIAKIISAEKIPESEKLIKLMLDLGEEQRQVVAGIGKSFPDPQVLVGRQIPILTNLESKNLMGETSSGMILAADSPDGPVLLIPEREVPPGSIVK